MAPPTINPTTPLYTPSIADSSDTDSSPTPVHSPGGGPTYDDLPPSYDDARVQAVNDARNGVTPIDPSTLEAHRLTLNEGEGEAEVWEYRVRGEEVDGVEDAPEYESHSNGRAPDYDVHARNLNSTIPIQHVSTSENIPVGQVGSQAPQPANRSISIDALLSRALEFTCNQPDADIQHAPRLTRCIAVPQVTLSRERKAGHLDSEDSVQFSVAYSKALHAHSISPAEFAEFLYGLNTLCGTTHTTVEDLVHTSLQTNNFSTVVHDYIRGSNEAFFAPRGLQVSFRSLPALLNHLNIPAEQGQRAAAVTSVLDPTSTAESRSNALYPWIETLDTNVPAPGARTLVLRAMAERLSNQEAVRDASGPTVDNASTDPPQYNQQEYYEDPPHSVPEYSEGADHERGRRGRGRRGNRTRGGRRGGSAGPFGSPGHGPFGPPGHGPFGAPNNGPFGGPVPQYGRWPGSQRGAGSSSSQPANEWAALGQNIGKWGEDFGKSMGKWGEQFGKEAAGWGQDVGKRANAWGNEVSSRASGSRNQTRGNPLSENHSIPDDLPPSYDYAPSGQETGILHGDRKVDPNAAKSPLGNEKSAIDVDHDDDDGDSSSTSSDSSDSDSDSDSDDEDYSDTEAVYLKRVRSINKHADAATQKGKKPAEEVARERDIAIAKAQEEKSSMDIKIASKASKRSARRELRQRGRELKRQHRADKREMRAVHGGKGKGKGKAKKSKEWKEAKKEYREKRKELRKEKVALRKEWREQKYERRKGRGKGKGKGKGRGKGEVGEVVEDEQMVWLVVENRGA